MSRTLTLPRMGETMEEGRVAAWIKKPGDVFRRGETLVEIETDKTIVELPALVNGVLGEILAAESALIKVGEPLCLYESEEAGERASSDSDIHPGPAERGHSVAEVVSTRSASLTAFLPVTQRFRATPKARHIARQRGIELGLVHGTGRRSRIEARDVEAHIDRRMFSRLDALPQRDESSGTEVRLANLRCGSVSYREWPGRVSNPLLVALHGFGGDAQTWTVWAGLLSRRGWRILAPDLPAHGATSVAAKSVDELVDRVAEFLGQLPERAFELVGHSLGGAVAARVALRLGERINRLTLIAPAGLGAEIDSQFIHELAEVRTATELTRLLKLVALRPPVLSGQQLESMLTSLGRGTRLAELATTLARDGRQHLSIVEELEQLEGRVRLIWGLEDRIIPWKQAAHAGSGIPVHFISDAGHMPHWDQPVRLANLFTPPSAAVSHSNSVRVHSC